MKVSIKLVADFTSVGIIKIFIKTDERRHGMPKNWSAGGVQFLTFMLVPIMWNIIWECLTTIVKRASYEWY